VTQSVVVNQTASAGTSSPTAPTEASAVNESAVYQIVFQRQLGCVAFCFDTSQTQVASQSTQVTQTAGAFGQLQALVANVSGGFQMVLQQQEGCLQECHNAAVSQSLAQLATTTQSAAGTTSADDTINSDIFFAAIRAIAANIGATFLSIVQTQIANCLDHCNGDALMQEAAQAVETNQVAAADLLGPLASAGSDAPATDSTSADPPAPGAAAAARNDPPLAPNPAGPDPAAAALGPVSPSATATAATEPVAAAGALALGGQRPLVATTRSRAAAGSHRVQSVSRQSQRVVARQVIVRRVRTHAGRGVSVTRSRVVSSIAVQSETRAPRSARTLPHVTQQPPKGAAPGSGARAVQAAGSGTRTIAWLTLLGSIVAAGAALVTLRFGGTYQKR
jgi:hypothetical protein